MPKHLGAEFHDLQELYLNLDIHTGELQASWGNLGYWFNDNGSCNVQYSTAAKTLANKLGDYAQLTAQHTVLDVGFGCGDQIELWQRQFGVNKIWGMNVSSVQTQYAQQQLAHLCPAPQLAQGNACLAQDWQALPQQFDRILALDCVYHFADKAAFFQISGTRLFTTPQTDTKAKAGQLVITDLLLAMPIRRIWHKLLLKGICKLSHIPWENLKTHQQYIAQLDELGLTLIKHQDISHKVMPGFARWLFQYRQQVKQKQKKRPVGYLGEMTAWGKYLGTALFLRWAYEHNILRYHLLCIEVKSNTLVK